MLDLEVLLGDYQLVNLATGSRLKLDLQGLVAIRDLRSRSGPWAERLLNEDGSALHACQSELRLTVCQGDTDPDDALAVEPDGDLVPLSDSLLKVRFVLVVSCSSTLLLIKKQVYSLVCGHKPAYTEAPSQARKAL